MTEDRQYIQRFVEYFHKGDAQQLIGRYYESRKKGYASQSANYAQGFPSKCKYCTLEKIAVLRVIQQDPAATQKYIATEIGNSERTVKSITVRLTEQGILVRKNGKRNGYWEIMT